MALELEPMRLFLDEVGAFDLGRIARLHRTCFDDAWSRKDLAQLLAMPGGFGLLARTDGFRGLGFDVRPAVGFSLCRVVKDESELLSLGTRPDQRQQGVAGALLDASMRCCRARGAARMFLEVAVDNTAAQRLYGRAGFVSVGRREGYYRRSDGATTAALTMRVEFSDG